MEREISLRPEPAAMLPRWNRAVSRLCFVPSSKTVHNPDACLICIMATLR